MALCDTCLLYSKQYDEFRQRYNDVIDGDKKEKHFCTMYNDNIPHNIFYNNGECQYYNKKEPSDE